MSSRCSDRPPSMYGMPRMTSQLCRARFARGCSRPAREAMRKKLSTTMDPVAMRRRSPIARFPLVATASLYRRMDDFETQLCRWRGRTLEVACRAVDGDSVEAAREARVLLEAARALVPAV